MKEPELYKEMCSYKNLELAYKKARKGKTAKLYVLEFEKSLKENLLTLQSELLFHTYKPKPLKTFILRDPKTRKISKSDFRDRVIHHALCNIIEPIFEKTFIYDSYANRIGKGTQKAIERFDTFKRKASKNNTRTAFVLKCDIKKYFDNVDHNILIKIIDEKVKDKRVIWLVKTILQNHHAQKEGKGMPLGNLTSQFFANVYLNELDQFVKHELKMKYYIRYVDDFVIFHDSRLRLEEYRMKIDDFLQKRLDLTLHPEKSKISFIKQGIQFLGFRIFYHHKLLKKNNVRSVIRKISSFKDESYKNTFDYDHAYSSFEGIIQYSKSANTRKLRKTITKIFEGISENKMSNIQISRWARA